MTARHRILIGYAILALGGVFSLWLLYRHGQELEERAEENAKATSALCVIRADRAEQVKQTNALLQEYRGALIFGIPRSLIEGGLKEDVAVVKALGILDCAHLTPSD